MGKKRKIMFTLELKSILVAKGYKANTGTLRNIGFTFTTARALLNGTAKTINLQQLELLCIFLRCTPNDLINYTPEPNNFVQPYYPIHTLTKANNPLQTLDHIKSMTATEMQEFQKMVEQFVEEKKGLRGG